MADEGHDRRNQTALCRTRTGEDGEVGIALEVARATDTVHHLRAADMCGVDVTIDVALDGGVDGDDSQTTDDGGVVGKQSSG